MSSSEEIAALEAKLEKLVSGGVPVEVEDRGGKRVRYNPGDAQQLRELITQKKAACGDILRTPARRVIF
jgi:hypothetical protein